MIDKQEINELKEILSKQDVYLDFIKKDGTTRSMHCTTCPDLIPEDVKTSGTGRTKPDDLIVVWDLDKNAWRSFRETQIVRYMRKASITVYKSDSGDFYTLFK